MQARGAAGGEPNGKQGMDVPADMPGCDVAPRGRCSARGAVRCGGAWGLAFLLGPLAVVALSEGTPAREASFGYRTRRTKHAMAMKRNRHVTVDLGQGRIGVFAGFGKREVEVFDVRTEAFQLLPCTRGFGDFHGIALGRGKALLVDGSQDCVFDLSARRFIPAANTFTGAFVRWPGMVPLPDGRVFLCGAFDGRFKPVDHCAVFDPKTRRFTPAGRLRVPRAHPTASRIAGGRILIAGGCDANSNHSFDTLEVFDLAAGTSKLLPARLQEPKSYLAGVVLSDGRVLLAGGYNRTRQLRSAEVYDPKTGALTRVGPLGMGRYSPRTARLPSGRVAFFGGPSNVRVVEVYCPRQRKFVLADQLLIDPRSTGFTATGLEAGGVLLVGGRINDAGDTLDTAEIFTETRPPPPPQPRADIRALVRQLGHDRYGVREAATRKLIKMGPDIAGQIRPLLRHDDPEVCARARVILRAITGGGDAPRWCVEVWGDRTNQQTLWFEDCSCGSQKNARDPRVVDIREAAARHKATRLVVRFPLETSYEQRVRLFNLAGWSAVRIIHLGEGL